MKKTERFRRWLIRKLGGFVIYPDEQHIVIEHKSVKPVPFRCKCIFNQEDLYTVNTDVLEMEATRALKEKMLKSILCDNKMFKIEKFQEDGNDGIEYQATMWIVRPSDMEGLK